jgi:hypothetical protein
MVLHLVEEDQAILVQLAHLHQMELRQFLAAGLNLAHKRPPQLLHKQAPLLQLLVLLAPSVPLRLS